MEVMYLSNVAEYNIFAAGNSNWQLSSAIHHVIHVTLQANNHRTLFITTTAILLLPFCSHYQDNLHQTAPAVNSGRIFAAAKFYFLPALADSN